MFLKTTVATLFLLSVSTGAMAQQGDPANGRALAQDRCARCHNIEQGAGFKMRPPSFQAIAIYREMTDIWSRIIAPSPHAGMPDVSWTMTPDEVQDVVAYITSLDRPVSLPAE